MPAWTVMASSSVSMPSTSPSMFTSGPPESPGWIGALVAISPVSLSESLLDSSLAVIDLPSPVMVPEATLGVPP